jgi:transcriptional regulator with XRE-family HTH domain
VANTQSGVGELIRRWRDRLDPASAGVPVTSGRRVPGVRREELAHLAGVSVDYLVRLEQGRATHPTDSVIGAVARALQLDRAERDHLYRTAGLLPPGDGFIDDHVSPGVQRILTRLSDLPVAVFAADWHLIRWTPSWAALIGDPSVIPGHLRNLVRLVFADGDLGVVHPTRSTLGAHHLENALVADLRSALADHPHDPRLRQLIGDMRAQHPHFDELWQTAAVGVHASDRKTIIHPSVGEITLDCDVLLVPDSDLRVVLYSATPGSRDAELLEFVRVVEPAARAR